MTQAPPEGRDVRRPLRLWPGVAASVLLILVRFLLPAVAPEAEIAGMDAPLVAVLGGLLLSLIVALWWLFFSRAPWPERLGALALIVVAVVAMKPLMHMSIQNGMMGMMFFIYATPPTIALALVAWAVASRGWNDGPRRFAMVVAILLGCGVWSLFRTNGVFGGVSDLQWRWTPTAEERLLAQAGNDPAPIAPVRPPTDALTPVIDASPASQPTPASTSTGAASQKSAAADTRATPGAPVSTAAVVKADLQGAPEAEWPGFRGANRDSVIRGIKIETDWAAKPPAELWRRPIGPGWSSFAVQGDLIYTQEQRGDDEVVACYSRSSGKPVWLHRDAARFWESNAGAGPRGTPTLSHGRVYAFGATGIVNVLDAVSGKLLWSHNAATDLGVKVPVWGFASSPVVTDGVVIVAPSGGLIAYDAHSGAKRWSQPSRGGSYSSPHLMTVEGIPQVLLLSGFGATSVAPGDGKVLWEHAWDGGAIVQPAVTPDGGVVINALAGAGGQGTRRLAVARGVSGWTVQERWTSIGLKPYFNDFVLHKGHAFGFDGAILSCIDLETGTRKWKGGRYGNGQLLLLADQDLLLVLSEKGELALVNAASDAFTEVARFKALEVKTWNHPVLVGDMLLVRNSEEMAAFRVSIATAR
jgi:outer membrane protein assembly factor BamB